MRPRTAAVGIMACVLVVAAFDVPAEPLLGIKTSGPAPVTNTLDCARRAKVPAPTAQPCAAMPCGWTVNVSQYEANGWPSWRTYCLVPVESRQTKGRR